MRVLCLTLALAAALAAEPTPADQQVNLGIEAYRGAHYAAAVEHFASALQFDPGYVDARFYLATSYMAQYIPGSEDKANLHLAQQAIDEFEQVLVQDPEHESAMSSIALIYFNERKYEDAREWYEKLISLDSENKEAWYTLGVIAWNQWRPANDQARARLNLRPDENGPLPDKAVREDLRRRFAAILEDGIEDLQKSLTIDPEYTDAMVYLNLLLRARAGWAESKPAYDKDVAAGDEWVRKADAIRKRKAQHVPARP